MNNVVTYSHTARAAGTPCACSLTLLPGAQLGDHGSTLTHGQEQQKRKPDFVEMENQTMRCEDIADPLKEHLSQHQKTLTRLTVEQSTTAKWDGTENQIDLFGLDAEFTVV